MTSSFPPPRIIEPTISHCATIILLHGRGNNGEEFAEGFFEAQSSDGRTLPVAFPTVKWVFPTSRGRYSTAFQEVMTEWFDIYSLKDTEERPDLQVEGLSESTAHVLELIDQEIKFVGGESTRVILGGISQGCAVAICAMLAARHKLGAFFGFCSWLPFRSQLEKLALANAEGETEVNVGQKLYDFFKSTIQLELSVESSTPTKYEQAVEEAPLISLDTPCFLSHCKDDDVVNIELGHQLRDVLQKLGVAVTWDEHNEGGHWIQEPEAIDRLISFISSHVQVLQATPS